MRNLYGILFIVLSIAALVGLKKYQSQSSTVIVEASSPEQSILYDTVLASGSIAFKNEIEIRTEITGLVKEVFFEEGDSIVEGDLLLKLDDTAYLAQVKSTTALLAANEIEKSSATEQLRELNRRFDNQNRLLKQGLIQEDSLEQLRSDLNIAKFNVELTNANLKRNQAELIRVQDLLSKTRFVAPISGLLTSVDIEEGETVIAGTTNIMGSSLMTLSDTSEILAEIRVNESDIAAIHSGQKVNVFVASHPKTPVTGKIVKIGSKAKVLGQTRGLSFKVKVALDKTDVILFSGTSCRAEIIVSETEKTLNLPIAALQQDDGGDFVWVVAEGGLLKKSFVTRGLMTDTHVAVLSGITATDQVVIGPGRTMVGLSDGQKVSLRTAL